jgi:3-dehydroquinate synthase
MQMPGVIIFFPGQLQNGIFSFIIRINKKLDRLTVHTENAESEILIGESYRNLPEYLPQNKQVIIITDTNVMKYYGTFIRSYPFIEIGSGEKHKNMDTLKHIYGQLLDLNAGRDSFIAAFGGGIVCDVAGFAASTYMRGIPFGFVPTTLLSQVDASVGGKNGVNFREYKNMIGTFNQPRFVLCDTALLQTLPDREYISGFAETVKAAVIRDAGLFVRMEENTESIAARDPETLLRIVSESVKIKAGVVESDERERDERRILNFGHTFGHAIELQTSVSHGEAVSIGMMIAAKWSVNELGLPAEQMERIENLLEKLGLPVKTNIRPEEMIPVLRKDKKREDDAIFLVLLEAIGKAKVCKTPVGAIEKKLTAIMAG